jgi:hypothetical protein
VDAGGSIRPRARDRHDSNPRASAEAFDQFLM